VAAKSDTEPALAVNFYEQVNNGTASSAGNIGRGFR
jgi:hypothetical protein